MCQERRKTSGPPFLTDIKMLTKFYMFIGILAMYVAIITHITDARYCPLAGPLHCLIAWAFGHHLRNTGIYTIHSSPFRTPLFPTHLSERVVFCGLLGRHQLLLVLRPPPDCVRAAHQAYEQGHCLAGHDSQGRETWDRH